MVMAVDAGQNAHAHEWKRPSGAWARCPSDWRNPHLCGKRRIQTNAQAPERLGYSETPIWNWIGGNNWLGRQGSKREGGIKIRCLSALASPMNGSPIGLACGCIARKRRYKRPGFPRVLARLVAHLLREQGVGGSNPPPDHSSASEPASNASGGEKRARRPAVTRSPEIKGVRPYYTALGSRRRKRKARPAGDKITARRENNTEQAEGVAVGPFSRENRPRPLQRNPRRGEPPVGPSYMRARYPWRA